MPPTTTPYEDLFHHFLNKYYAKEVTQLSLSYPDDRSLVCRFRDLDMFNSELADRLLAEPDEVLVAATAVLRDMDLATGIPIEEAFFRVGKMPNRKRIQELRADDVGTLISIEGVVPNVTAVAPQMVEAVFECPFCGHIFSVEQTGQEFKEPVECEEETGGCGRKVQKFKLHEAKSKFVNAQKIRLQDAMEDLRGGEIPQMIEVGLRDDLTGVVVPGDRVVVVGILRQFQKRTQFGKTNTFKIWMDANSVELKEEVAEEVVISEADEERIKELQKQPDVYKQLIDSLAPSVWGHDDVKEAIVLLLFGGVSFFMPDGTRRRGDIHALLVGDPGVAKSVLLTAAAKLALRGILTDGSGSSGAGLTAAVVKDKEFSGDAYIPQAGAMVLADKGVLAVDEISRIKPDDLGRMHMALEQQEVHLNKAGLNVKMNSRCAMLAAANPTQGRFDKYEPIGKQIKLSAALISRFDLIFTLMDIPEEEKDKRVATHIARSYGAMENKWGNNGGDSVEELFTPPISQKLFKMYLATAKRINPRVGEVANKKFIAFYLGLRKLAYDDEDAPVPVTARELEALFRLGQAKARSRLSKVVSADDADTVIKLVEGCLMKVYSDPETGKLDVDWVNAGTTKTRRDRGRQIKAIITELETKYGDVVPIEDVLNTAEEEGMDRDKAEEVIEAMKQDGLLFSRRRGVVGLVR